MTLLSDDTLVVCGAEQPQNIENEWKVYVIRYNLETGRKLSLVQPSYNIGGVTEVKFAGKFAIALRE